MSRLWNWSVVLPGCLVATLLLGPKLASARPLHKKALADHFGPLLPKKLNDCLTCHLPDQGKSTESEKPHNAFGLRLVAVKAELRKSGKGTDIIARLEAIGEEDSDGDGASNLLEILAGRFPGDAKDRASADELTAARKALGALAIRKNEYKWRPFETVVRPAVPTPRNGAWLRNPIDAFIAVEHDKLGLQPRPEAPRHVLIRRLYLDLIGLPPTPAEIQAFEKDTTPDAYEKLVDRLLASPHYGERWGRHWMDIWRYSDWTGYGAEVRDSQPHIWRWRDWIVESLNQDKPYDRMVQEMLAGDELAPDDPKTVRATGFLVRNWYKFNRDVWLDRTIEHTSKAFLGVTLNCARCHDHFFDPLTQKEYYQFRAFFEAHDIRTDRVPGQPDVNKDGVVRVYDAKPEAPTFLYIRGEDHNPDKKNPLPPGVPGALGGMELAIQPIKLPIAAQIPERRPFVLQELIDSLEKGLALHDRDVALTKQSSWMTHLAFLPANGPMGTVAVLGMQPRLEAAHKVAVMTREASLEVLGKYRLLSDIQRLKDFGKAKTPEWAKLATELTASERRFAWLKARNALFARQHGLTTDDPKAKGTPQQKLAEAEKALAKAEADLKLPPSTNYSKPQLTTYPATSTGRRLALARWIADPQNPLTARVAANHMWLRHFGKALVPSVFDFGANGQPPSHPALLDWLAAEFMNPTLISPPLKKGGPWGVRDAAGTTPPNPPFPRGGDMKWSMKHLHRLMVTSSAYRMDSTTDEASALKDQDNRFLWRMNARRMEAEIVRDSVLAVAGQLDRTFGGPELDHNLGLTTRRRTIYYRYAPERMMEFMTIFDSANVVECYQRSESVVPQQALAMANSILVQSQARLLARQLDKKAADPQAFIKTSFAHVLGRTPTAQEVNLCEDFLTQQRVLLRNPKGLSGFVGGPASPVPPSGDPQLRARENLLHVLFNHNEFVTIR